MMMEVSLIHHLPKKFLLFLVIATISTLSSCYGNLDVACLESEKRALLSFKQGLDDFSNRLSSWDVEADCCKWAGVICNNLTGHVVELHLQNLYVEDYETREKSKLGGEVNPSLLDLKHLSYLDLSQNDFGGIPIPSFLGSLPNLRYLNLSEAGFAGTIPHQLGNLSNLHSLSLKGDYYYEDPKLDIQNLGFLSGLSSLEHLDLSRVKLKKAANYWLQEESQRALNCKVLMLLASLGTNFVALHSQIIASLMEPHLMVEKEVTKKVSRRRWIGST